MIRSVFSYLDAGNVPHQEDNLLCNEGRGIFVVADGFGGPDAGTAASKVVCDGIKGFLEREAGDLEATLPFVLKQYYSLAANVLFNALIHANRLTLAKNKTKNMNERGGASVVAAFLDKDFLALASAGNASASLFREGRRVELVRARCLSRLIDPFVENQNRAPLMAVGLYNDLEPEMVEVKVKPGDFLLLHTDGLTRAQLNEFERMHVSQSHEQHQLKQMLQEFFSSQTYHDNVAVVGVEF